MKAQNNITAAILAGGKSSRFGEDKGLATVRGLPMIGHVEKALYGHCSGIMVIANQPGYERTGLVCYPDIIPGKGPLGGLYTALCYAPTQRLLLVACDMPQIQARDVAWLCTYADGGEDAIVPFTEKGDEPLFAIYATKVRKKAKSCLDANRLSMRAFLQDLSVKRVAWPEARMERMANINTREDWKMVEGKRG